MQVLKRFLDRIGYEVRRISPDRRNRIVYPNWTEMLYSARQPGDARFFVPISSCVCVTGYPFLAHPYTRTLLEYATGRSRDYDASYLKAYYRDYPVARGEDLFPELNDGSVPRALVAEAVPDSHLIPWVSDDLSRRSEAAQRVLKREFPGISAPTNPLFGPMSDAQGRMELQRLIHVFDMIRSEGFRLADDRRDDVQGLLLRDGENVRFLVVAGKHRVAAIAALLQGGSLPESSADFRDQIPVRLRRPVVVEKRDVLHWPRVRDGVWSEDAASAYFDRLFQGRSCFDV